MQVDFYATSKDKKSVLDFIFLNTSFKVLDHYSPFGETIREYRSTQEILDTFDLDKGRNFATTLALWNPEYGESGITHKVDLNPEKCNGHTFRFRTTGWSIQQLYFGGLDNNVLYYSTFQGYNERGALQNNSYNTDNKTTNLIDWKSLVRDRNKVARHIRGALLAQKINSYSILKDASEGIAEGLFALQRA